MKIEIFLTSDINEKCTGMSCFECDHVVSEAIQHEKSIKGIILINGEATKFSFSPISMDGDIFTNNDDHRRMVKYIIPIYVQYTMGLCTNERI